jgi:hypothetical protein
MFSSPLAKAVLAGIAAMVVKRSHTSRTAQRALQALLPLDASVS